MPQTDVGKTITTDLTNQQEDYSVAPEDTDAATDQKETEYINQEWTQQWAYYKKTPKLKSDIDVKCSWIVGKGWSADEKTTMILDAIKGFGKDTFNSIIENMERVAHIGGDSFAEIITDEEGTLINLKPLNPGKIKIFVDKAGILKRYEQTDKQSKSTIRKIISKITRKKANLRFKPEQIFHLCRNRGADEIHGESLIPAVEPIILSIEEAMEDWKIVMHRNVVPLRIIEVDEDDTAKLLTLKTMYENAIKNKEVIIIPKGTVEFKEGTVSPNATLNPLPWIEMLTQHFHQATGVPDCVGGGGTVSLTDANSKIKYLSFEQTIRESQHYDEEQILAQLNLVVTFEMPALLENDMISGKPNEAGAGSVAAPQEEPVQGPEANDTTAEVEGRT